jgi:hypothetical protein
MATWDEVRAHLRLRWQVVHDEPTNFAVSARVPVATGEMQQAVGMAPTQLDGNPWLSIIGELFPEAALTPRGALVYADRLLLGAIVLRDDRYLLRSGVPLSGLALDALDRHLAILVREAVRLRVNLIGPSSADRAASAFDNWAE